ncbi:MAG: cytochrome c [Saprospiraceae bacterium]
MKIKIVFILIAVFVFACAGTKELTMDEELILGKEKFKLFCSPCHGIDGKLNINHAKDLTKSISGLKSRVKTITEGKGMMTPFKGILTPEEIEAVAKYTIYLRKKSKQ